MVFSAEQSLAIDNNFAYWRARNKNGVRESNYQEEARSFLDYLLEEIKNGSLTAESSKTMVYIALVKQRHQLLLPLSGNHHPLLQATLEQIEYRQRNSSLVRPSPHLATAKALITKVLV